RSDQARDDRRGSLAVRGEDEIPPGAAGARRTRARGAEFRARPYPCRIAEADGWRGRTGRAAARRGRRGRQLGRSALSEAGPRVLVTGAGGFLGARIAAALDDEFEVVRMLRQGEPGRGVVIADLDDAASLAHACEGASFVVHCAGHAHAYGARDDAAAHERINHLGTRRLAEAAAAAGVRQFASLSSAKAA